MKTYLVGEELPEKYRKTLLEFGRVVVLPRSEATKAPTGTHPDALVGVVGDEIFVPKNETSVSCALTDAGISHTVSVRESGEKYPDDCAVNFFTVGKFFVAKTDTVAPEALISSARQGFQIVDVKQGYAHCATAVVSGGVVTADAGIYRALSDRGVPSLLVKAGGVSLPPYEYGFIGGASGMIDDKTILFFGSLDTHPSGNEIRAFLSSLGARIVEGDGDLSDHGGFIALDT